MKKTTAIMIAAARAIGAKNPDISERNPDYMAIEFLGPRERALLPDNATIKVLDLDYATALRRALL